MRRTSFPESNREMAKQKAVLRPTDESAARPEKDSMTENEKMHAIFGRFFQRPCAGVPVCVCKFFGQEKSPLLAGFFAIFGSANGNRTRVLRLRISRPNP